MLWGLGGDGGVIKVQSLHESLCPTDFNQKDPSLHTLVSPSVNLITGVPTMRSL